MKRDNICVFLAGKDYHLGDLLWLTAVLREYRRQRHPDTLILGCPDRPISRILEDSPLLDELRYGEPSLLLRDLRRQYGARLVVHDLRIVPLAGRMICEWRRQKPWIYYHDLWFQPRGQWLATLLGLGPLQDFRPVLSLRDDDRVHARVLEAPYVVLAPHTGQYKLPLANHFWHHIKGWPWHYWALLSDALQRDGYHVVTLGAGGQEAVPGTKPLLGLPVRQAAAVIERAAGLVTVESGLWFVAAALRIPFLIVPWWLPRSINWPAPMDVPHCVVYREQWSVYEVLSRLQKLIEHADV